MECLCHPIGEFGDHFKGYFGCIWCTLNIQCAEFHPIEGKSLLFREDTNFIDTQETIHYLQVILEEGKDMALDRDQKQFIRRKVRQLGDMKAVKRFYFKDCTVTKYAHRVAEKMFSKGGDRN